MPPPFRRSAAIFLFAAFLRYRCCASYFGEERATSLDYAAIEHTLLRYCLPFRAIRATPPHFFFFFFSLLAIFSPLSAMARRC